jgi:spore germination protein KB
LDNQRVPFFEVILLSITVVISTAVLFLPYLTARAAGQDAWLSVLLAGGIAIIPAWCVGVVMARFPHKSIIEALPTLLGNVLGKALGFGLLTVFFLAALLVVWQLEEFIIGTLMPETPGIAIRITFVLAVVYTVLHGAVPLLRTNVYIMLVGIIVVGLVIGLPMARMNPGYLLPVLEQGPNPMLEGAALLFGWICQVPVVIMMFHRFVENKFLKGAGVKSIKGVIVVTLALLVGALGTIATFGPRQTASSYYPSFAVASIISVGAFLEHIEVTFVGVWIAAMFVAGAFYIMSFADGTADLLGVKRSPWLYGLIIAALLGWPLVIDANIDVLIKYLSNWFPWAMTAAGGALPLLLLFRVLTLPPPTDNDRVREERKEEKRAKKEEE